jgi:peptidoglycan/LPS O-acetylase OafA/YrhL
MIRTIQILWGLGVAAWNAYGLYQLQNNEAPPGPTASLAVGVAGLIIAVIFMGTDLQKWDKWLYGGLCALCCFLGAAAVYGAFTKDPSLWPSETWRWAGILLNGIGSISFFI